MREIVVNDSSKFLTFSRGNLVIKNKENVIQLEIALDLIDHIKLFGNPRVSTQLIKAMAIKGKAIHYYTAAGQYITSTYEAYKGNFERQWQQIECAKQDDFSLALGKRILSNKVHQQASLLSAFNTTVHINEIDIKDLKRYSTKIQSCEHKNQMLGFEGKAAKKYFRLINELVPGEFKFSQRSKRPAKDIFNSVLNFGYSILYSYMRGALISYGLHLGFGFVHANRRNHAALASDLMEEWRAIIVDDTAMKLVQSEDFSITMVKKSKKGAFYLTNEGKKLFIRLLQQRMGEKHHYFSDIKRAYNFYYAVNLQIESLVTAIEEEDPDKYRQIGC